MARTTKSRARTPDTVAHEGPESALPTPEATEAHPVPTEAPEGPSTAPDAGHGADRDHDPTATDNPEAPTAESPTPAPPVPHTPPVDPIHAVTFGETRAIGELRLAEYNPRVMAPEMMDRLMASIRQYGFVEPVVIRPEDNLVAGGHQRVEALKRLLRGQGVSPRDIDAVRVPVAVLPIGCSDIAMKSLNTGLNRIVGSWDFSLLNDVLREVYAASIDGLVDFETSGFVPADLDDLSKQLAAIHYVPGSYGVEAGARSGARGGFGGGSTGESTPGTTGTGSPGGDDPDAALAAYLAGGTPEGGSEAPATPSGSTDPTSPDPEGVARAGGGIPESLQGCGYDAPTVSGVLRAAVARHGAGMVVAVEFPAEAEHLAAHARECLSVLSARVPCTPGEALYAALLMMLDAYGVAAPPIPEVLPRATLAPEGVDGALGATTTGDDPRGDEAPAGEAPDFDDGE